MLIQFPPSSFTKNSTKNESVCIIQQKISQYIGHIHIKRMVSVSKYMFAIFKPILERYSLFHLGRPDLYTYRQCILYCPRNIILHNINHLELPSSAENIIFAQIDYYEDKEPSEKSYTKEIRAIQCLPNIYSVIFSNRFDQSVDNLPHSIQKITFGHSFNQTVYNLPPNITHIILGTCFDQKVENLPPNITHLNFCGYFNQKINRLPPKIIHLSINCIFNHELNFLPQHIIFFKNSGEIQSKNRSATFLYNYSNSREQFQSKNRQPPSFYHQFNYRRTNRYLRPNSRPSSAFHYSPQPRI